MPIAIGLTSYVARHYNDWRYYVGYANGAYWCAWFIKDTTKQMPFPGGDYYRQICISEYEAVPGFDIMSNGTLVVDIPTDSVGGANRYKSVNSGYTWELVV